MLRDAAPEQIRRKHLLWEYLGGLRISTVHLEPSIDEEHMAYFEERQPKEFDLKPFKRSRKNVVDVLSPFLSKSESVFCEAVDGMDEFIERGTQHPMLVVFQLFRILSESHTFDKGDTQEMQWIDGERHDVRRLIDPYGMVPPQAARLTELDSKDSFLVQAADFAAGIARETWSRNSILHLVDTFDYVTYNGRRISETDAVTLAGDLARRCCGSHERNPWLGRVDLTKS